MGRVANTSSSVVRASLGAMSTVNEVDAFLAFLYEAFISEEDPASVPSSEKGPVVFTN